MQKTEAGSATGPKTVAGINAKHQDLQNSVDTQISSTSSEVNELTDTLTEMSQELYGTPQFEDDSNWWSNFLTKHSWWVAALLLVAGFEFSLNAMSFEIFDRTQNETYMMAVLFGTFVALVAHFTGYSFRRYFYSEKNNGSYLLIGLSCLFIAGFGLYTVAGFRVQYRQEMNLGFNMSQIGQAGFAFIVFFGGALVSFFHTSSVPNLKIEKVFNKKLKRLNNLKDKLSKLYDKKEELSLAHEKELQNFVATTAEQKKQQDAREARALGEKRIAFQKSHHQFNDCIDQINNLVDNHKDNSGEEQDLKDACVVPLSRMEICLNKMRINVTDDNNAELKDAEETYNNLKTKYGHE